MFKKGPKVDISFYRSIFFNSCLQAHVALNQYIELFLPGNNHLH
jgi:hypothetical protein